VNCNRRMVQLKEILSFRTGKLDSNAAEDSGRYPFFTCSPTTLSINTFAFDDEAILLAGNNANGVFSVKYFNGKFNAYQRTYVIVPLNKKEISVKWLYFQIQHITAELQKMSIGTATKFLTKRMLDSYELNLPPFYEQEKVADILWSLDNKITLNRQINQTLESMAQALFKSWFVDFEPVKAKMAALSAGGNDDDANLAAMSAISGKSAQALLAMKTNQPEQYQKLYTTAELFPSEMVESELGEVPKGWEVKSLKTQCELNRTSWTTKTLPNSVRYVDLASAKDGVISDIQTFFETEIPSRARRILNVGDTIIGTVRPANRSFALVYDKNLTGSTGFAVLTPRFEYLKEFVYLLSTSDDNIERLARLADGGAYPAVRPEQVVDVEVVIPDDLVMQLFHSKTQFIFDRIALNRKESQHLTSLRDTLLPKLLSGELSVDGMTTHV